MMKAMKKLFFMLCATLMLMSCSKGGSYKITVSFPDDSFAGKTAYLTSYDTGDTLQQGQITGNTVALEGNVDASYYARLIVDGNRLGFIVEEGEISIHWADGKVSGGDLNKKLDELGTAVSALEDEMDSVLTKAKEQKMPESELESLMNSYLKKESDAFHQAYVDNKDNGIGPWALYNYLMFNEFNKTQLDSILNDAPASYKKLERIQKALSDAKQRELTAVGKMFTDFTVTGDDSKPYKLSDYVGKGTYTLVDFWASWCGPCRREIANIKKLYEKYNGNGMEFLGVAVWDAPADTRAAMKSLNIPWPVIVGNKKLDEPTNIYGIMGIPHIIVFDPKGVIVSRGLDGDKLTAKVDELMNK